MNTLLILAASLWSIAMLIVSLRLPTPLGRYRPASLLIALLCAYNVVPFLLVGLFRTEAEALISGVFEYYAPDRLVALLGYVAAVTTSTVGGQALALHLGGRQRRQGRRAPVWFPASAMDSRRAGMVAFWLATALAATLSYQLRGLLLGGYHESFGEDDAEVFHRGTLSSAFVLMLVAYLFVRFVSQGRWLAKPHRLADLASTLALLGIGGALLSLGGRLYVVSALVLLLMLRASRNAAPLRNARRLWLLTGAGMTAISLVGLWRTDADFSITALLINLLSEPGFVSISLASLMGANAVPALHAPTFLLGDAVGLAPAFVYPDKINRLFSLRQEFDVSSPFGGLNGLASTTANFGWAGAIVVAFLLGAATTAFSVWASRASPYARRRWVVVVATALPALSLYRDPFVISVYKNLLQNAIVFPLLLVVAGHGWGILRRGGVRLPTASAARPA